MSFFLDYGNLKRRPSQEQFTRLSEKRVQYYYNLFVDEQLPAVRAVYLLEITYHLLTLNVPDWKKRIKILIDKNDFLLSEYLILFRGDQELLDLLVFANMQD